MANILGNCETLHIFVSLIHKSTSHTAMHLANTPDTAPLHINYSTDANRVNPSEMRYLRQVVAATTISCVPTAVQVEVTRAYHEGINLTQEARVLLNEYGYAAEMAVVPMRRA